MNLAMKIKFPKKVRAALREFSKVDREEYIQNAVAKQLAKDGRISAPSDVSRGTVEFFSGGGSLFIDEWSDSDTGQKETEPVTIETPKPVSPVSAFDFGPSSGGIPRDNLPRYQDKELEAMYREGIRNRDWVPPSEVLVRSPVSDAEQKESEPVSESSRVTTWGPVEGTVHYCRDGSLLVQGSPASVSDSAYGSGSGFGSSSGGNSSNELLPFQQEMQKAIEQGYKVSIRHRDQIPPSEVLYRSTGSVGNVPNSSGGGLIVIDEYDAEQKESEPVSETPRSKPWDPVEANARYHSSGSVYCYFAGGGIATGVPVSDSDYAAGGGGRFAAGSSSYDSVCSSGSGTGGNASQSN